MKSWKFNFNVLLIGIYLFSSIEALQQNKSIQPASKEDHNAVLIKKLTAYRAFQPAYHRLNFNKIDVKPDYDRSYDAEYDGMVSNFTASIYDDNPPIYPNPDSYQSQQIQPQNTNTDLDSDVDIPDDSLADGDLEDHNIIDSITYVYGFSTCKCKSKWKILILIGTGISIIVMSCTILYLMCGYSARKFRTTQIYVTSINLCGCMEMCMVLYFQAVLGTVGTWWCERVALVLHYGHVSCATWVVLLAHDLVRTAYGLPPRHIRYHYLVGYGLTGLLVMFNYALSMEHYETKNYCWMSIEKGMVIGFMAPVMVLILVNTILVMQGLKKINKIQGEELHAKLQELIDQHFSNMKTRIAQANESPLSIQSRKHPESTSSDPLDKYSSSDDEGPNCVRQMEAQQEKYWMDEKYYNDMDAKYHLEEKYNVENASYLKNVTEQDILNFMYFDRLASQSQGVLETSHLKSLLHMSLVVSPFWAVNWVLGVVALENSDNWPTPALYVITALIMLIYISSSLCALPSNTEPQLPPDGTTIDVERQNNEEHSVVVVTNVLVRARSNCMKNLKLSRSVDIVPLLDPKPPTPSSGQNDTISTISI